MKIKTTMNRIKSGLTLLSLIFIITFTSCKKDEEPAPTTGTVSGLVTDFDTGAALADASVILFDAATNSPVSTSVSDVDGNYTFEIAGGDYFLKFYKQGYISNPPAGINPIPFNVVNGAVTDKPAEMIPSNITGAGFITGLVTDGSAGYAGALIVAEMGGKAYSAVSDQDGNYSIFNVPAGTYTVQAYYSGYSSSTADASVTASTETTGVDVTLTSGASGSFNGTFKVISQTTILEAPALIDISLVHPITDETIPGLTLSLDYASSLPFSFSNVPDGSYKVRATYSNDYIVLDPDYITKFGDYTVTVTNGVGNPDPIDITATSAVLLQSPTNAMTTTIPVEVTSTTPTFSWTAYASSSDYVIEVIDAATGSVIWGGFSTDAVSGLPVKNITIPSNTTEVVYNDDQNATVPTLESGKIYQWKVYASKNDVSSDTGWTLISASEAQMGLIKIQ